MTDPRVRSATTAVVVPLALSALLAGLLAVVGLAAPAGAAPAVGTPAGTTPRHAAAWRLTDPFTREVVRRGDVDRGPYDIQHVYEVQYRLKRLGLFKGRPNGHFRKSTEDAVLAFQHRDHLTPTGTVDRQTWKPLILQTLRAKGLIPANCHSAGWHACYDRYRHQLTLFHNGRLLNAWMGRGGAQDMVTRLGTWQVFRRDKRHFSSIDGAPMPYAQFFSGGEAIHGSRFMVNPFRGHSHGCINLYVKDARQLWRMTADHPLSVHVYGRWS